MTIDSREFRDALGRFATGVTIITTRDGRGEPVGITANAFASLSLDPPLVLFNLNRRAYSLNAFLGARHFAVNILEVGQEGLSSAFANALSEKWDGVDYETWDTGAPILNGCLTNLECRLHETHEGGDHLIMVGRVLKIRMDRHGEPLLYFGSRYCRLEPVER